MEKTGGNFYRPHMLMVHSGQFWRCKHGLSCLAYKNCWKCAVASPKDFLKWHKFLGLSHE